MKNQKGFTLIELVVAVAIMLLLGAAVTPMLLSHMKDAKVAAANETLINAKTAFDSYFVKNQGVVTADGTSGEFFAAMVDQNFIPAVPSIDKAGALTLDVADSTDGESDVYTINSIAVQGGFCTIATELDKQIDDGNLSDGNFTVTNSAGDADCDPDADNNVLSYLITSVGK